MFFNSKKKKPRKYKRRKKSLFSRLIKSLLLVVIMSSLVLATSILIKKLATFDTSKIAGYVEMEPQDEKADVAGVEDVKTRLSIAIMADSEDNLENLQKSLELAKEKGVRALFFLGDFTRWGDRGGLQASKDMLDASGLSYYSLPGDHDLAQSVQEGDLTGLKYFKDVFGNNFHSVVVDGTKFVVLDNSANYTTISSDLVNWFSNELQDADFVLLSQPLYHPLISRVMGVVDGEEISIVRRQADSLLDSVRDSDAKAIIAADQHYFSRYIDPARETLEHVVVGALVDISEGDELRNPQSPRFSILNILENGKYNIEEIVL